MPIVHRSESGLDTGMFSVHQMHPETALRLALGVTLGGLGEQRRSLQSMITEHDTALVIARITIEYRRELTFFSASSVVSHARVSLRDDGAFLLFDVDHRVGADPAVVVQLGLRPIRLTGGPALDAVAAPVDPRVRALFDPDEIVPKAAAPARHLQAEISRWVADAEEIGEGAQPLFIGRNDCEFADQWLGARLPSFVASAREQLMFSGAADFSVGVKRPLATFRGEFFRPMFFGDQGMIEVRAYQSGDQTFFVHRVLGSPIPGTEENERPLCALAVEVF